MDGVGAEEAGVEPTEDACAPSNGFEARAPHRERYSSARQDCRVSRYGQPPALGDFGKPPAGQYSSALSISCSSPPPASMLLILAALSVASSTPSRRRATAG